MRILGGHDYYDNALAYGRDDSILLVRDAREIPAKCGGRLIAGFEHPGHIRIMHKGGDWHRSGNLEDNGRFRIRPLNVWFCGKRYHGIQTSESGFNRFVSQPDTYRFFWNYDKFLAFLSEYDLQPAEHQGKWLMRGMARLDDYFKPRTAKGEELDWLLDNRIAIATLEPPGIERPDWCWRINGSGLSTINFQQVFDPYTAFQELQMWVGGVMTGSERKTVTITDDRIKIQKHGFDLKTSFRKTKG